MFGYEALYDLIVTKRTVVRESPKTDLHFGDAVIVNHDDSDSETSRMVQSLANSVRTSVDSTRGLAGNMLRSGRRGSGTSNLSGSGSDFDPNLANAVLWEWSLKSVTDSEENSDGGGEGEDENQERGNPRGLIRAS